MPPIDKKRRQKNEDKKNVTQFLKRILFFWFYRIAFRAVPGKQLF